MVLIVGKTVSSETFPQKPQKKIILFWTTFFEAKDFGIGTGNKPFRSCPSASNECLTTYDRNMLNQSDAVIFHIRDLNLEDLPSHRRPHQRWIFYLMESPHHTPNFLDNLADFFNWTMTYRYYPQYRKYFNYFICNLF